MTESEWSDFEDMVTLGDQARYEPSWRSALTECAYKELKERRESEEWLLKRSAIVVFDASGVSVDHHEIASGLHASVVLARRGAE